MRDKGDKVQKSDYGLLQDDTFVAFEDIRPAAKHHLLVTPKAHVGV